MTVKKLVCLLLNPFDWIIPAKRLDSSTLQCKNEGNTITPLSHR